jgi:peptidoglycan hydrolase-like protein with peptidoglycan-binding domain
MADALGLLGLLALLFGGKAGPAPAPSPAPPARPPAALPAAPAPWPQVQPTGLPPFPGSGWEYDEPPPVAVQQRAGQLLSQLWSAGAGTFKIEQTAGRWIAYRAEKVKSGKQGVVAYRQATKRLPAPAPAGAAQRPPAAPAAPRVVTSPGLPQKPRAPAPAPASPVINVPALSPMQMPDLKLGMGLKPAAPVPDVALVQQKLGVSPVDGRFGKDTQTAVIKFQQKTGLAPANQTIEQLRARGFGAVKQATWIKLFGA